MLRPLQLLILLCVSVSLSGCETLPVHLYDVDEVYRFEKPVTVEATYWNGTDWVRAGKVTIPNGAYVLGHIPE